MLPRPDARVDAGLRGEVRGGRGRVFVRMAQDDGVAVRLDHADRVGEGLAFWDGGPLGTAESEGTPAKPRHRTFEREPGPRGGFVEKRREDLAFERSGPFLTGGDRDHLAGGPQNELDVGRSEVANREDVSPPEARHQVPNS